MRNHVASCAFCGQQYGLIDFLSLPLPSGALLQRKDANCRTDTSILLYRDCPCRSEHRGTICAEIHDSPTLLCRVIATLGEALEMLGDNEELSSVIRECVTALTIERDSATIAESKQG
jgi:hypothetical protein